MSRRYAVVMAICAAAAAALILVGGASAAFPGTNGKIAFARPIGAYINWDIYSIDPANGSLLQLTSSPENDEFPSYSADGERIVFQRRPNGGATGIWVMNSDGSGQTQITAGSSTVDDYDPAFAPDGSRIVFTRVAGHGNQVWTMNADGSDQRQLTFGGLSGAASFSPDGKQILFTQQGSPGFFGVSVMNADGSDQTPVTTATSNHMDFSPDFSPDGRRIVFSRQDSSGDTHLYVMNSDGTGQTPLTTPADFYNDSAFSPDGQRVAFGYQNFDVNQGGLAMVDALGTDRNFTPLTGDGRAGWPLDDGASWQPLNPPACDVSGRTASKSVKAVKVSVSCANENAVVTAEGSGKAKVPKRVGAAKAKQFKIPAVTTQVPAGTPTEIGLKVSKKGQKVLKKATKAGKKGKATVAITSVDDLGLSSEDSLKVKFKPRKK